jgi:hypothetical protein
LFDTPLILLFGAATFLLAGFVKGVIGTGLPAIALGMLGLMMPVAQAAALVILPAFVTNIWQSAGPRFGILLRRIWLMLAGIGVGAWLGAGLMTGHNSELARIGLGVALVAYAGVGLLKIRLHIPPRAEPWLAPVVGVATGVIAAATGIFVVPSGPYLQGIGLQKDDLVQALGITYTVSTVALAAILAQGGAMPWSIAGPSVLALVAVTIGMAIGQKARSRVREETFRTIFFVGLLLLGGHLALRGIL